MRRVEKTESKLDRVIDIATQLAVATLRAGHSLQDTRSPRHLVSHAIAIVETAEQELDAGPETKRP
jgi:hypothetical protein